MENIIFSRHLTIDSTVHFFTVVSPIDLTHSSYLMQESQTIRSPKSRHKML